MESLIRWKWILILINEFIKLIFFCNKQSRRVWPKENICMLDMFGVILAFMGCWVNKEKLGNRSVSTEIVHRENMCEAEDSLFFFFFFLKGIISVQMEAMCFTVWAQQREEDSLSALCCGDPYEWTQGNKFGVHYMGKYCWEVRLPTVNLPHCTVLLHQFDPEVGLVSVWSLSCFFSCPLGFSFGFFPSTCW